MLKKIFLISFLILLSGCSNEKISPEKKIYNENISILESSNKVSENIPFDIEVYVDKIIETEVMYRVIIDNPKSSIRNIKALVIHDKYTEDVFPSSGIFDENYSLIPNVVNKSSNYVEGIILAGYIPFDGEIENLNITFKVLVIYDDEDGINHKIIYSTKR